MSEEYNAEKYIKLRDAFDSVDKKISNYATRNLPADTEKRNERISQYKAELVSSYNDFAEYADQIYANVPEKSKTTLNESIASRKLKVLKCLGILGLALDLPNKFQLIEIENIVDKESFGIEQDNSEIFVNTSKKQTLVENPTEQNVDFGENSATFPQTDPIVENSNTQNSGVPVAITPANSRRNSIDSVSGNFNTQNSGVPVEITPANSRSSSIVSISGGLNTLNQDASIDPTIDNSALVNSTEVAHQNPNEMSTLSLSDILNGIPDFSSKSHDEIKQFIAKADMIHSLAAAQEQTVLMVIRAKLATANKLGNISTANWTVIKNTIREKYKASMSFETAQERLLSIKQGTKESLDDYANRIKHLLDALNSASSSSNPEVLEANRSMNEGLAVRKFKQNIFDEKIRIMALSTDHSSLSEAIAHASEKKEQLFSSNIARETHKAENKSEHSNKNSNNNKNTKNFDNNKKRDRCAHCKKSNHTTDNCFFKPKQESASNTKTENRAERYQNKPRGKNANVAVADGENIEETVNGMPLNQASIQPQQPIQLQPYHYLNC